MQTLKYKTIAFFTVVNQCYHLSLRTVGCFTTLTNLLECKWHPEKVAAAAAAAANV